ncbi:nicotinate phosphoribosyltransferase [Mycena maculata]|uniref:Nicotinate phosphoribosyltransferase n=1 Tax=Mycena maculata TaxID=230809 RepID=A0AAD7HQS7_9AGAR|nr:nicotinate phosphoribosyltransferase [Mycena maculata]
MSSSLPLPRSILDTDLYKLTMQQAVLRHFPATQASYKFTLRDKNVVFTKQAFDLFQETVDHFGDLKLTESEHSWLAETCPYFTEEYLSYLRDYRFKPTEQVRIKFVPASPDGTTGLVEIDTFGSWADTIFWEVPLMATLSEVYFTSVVTDWSYDGQQGSQYPPSEAASTIDSPFSSALAYEKGRVLLRGDCVFSEFGTRRRRSYETQDIVVGSLVRAYKEIESKGKLSGTSNVHLAHKYGITPVGTIAHEWFMGVAALKGYEDANSVAMNLWEDVYPNTLLIALTDTFSSEAFFKSFASDKERAMRWQGLRQDSGDPFVFGARAKEVFDSLGIEPSEKMIIYSDALNIDKALRLKQQANDLGLNVSFGIGTFLTNDFKKTGSQETSRALNMVIKLSSVDDRPCVKISDDLTKNTGNTETVQMVKQIYNLTS